MKTDVEFYEELIVKARDLPFDEKINDGYAVTFSLSSNVGVIRVKVSSMMLTQIIKLYTVNVMTKYGWTLCYEKTFSIVNKNNATGKVHLSVKEVFNNLDEEESVTDKLKAKIKELENELNVANTKLNAISKLISM